MKRLTLKLVSAVCLVMAFVPVLFIIADGGAPVWHALLWPIGAALLALLTGLLPGGWVRLGVGVAVCVALVAGTLIWSPSSWAYLLPAVAVFWLVLFRAALPPFEEWPLSMLLAGLLAHPAGMIAARANGHPEAISVLRWLFLLYILIFLLLCNHMMLIQSATTRDGRRPPRRIRAGNLGLAVGAAALIAVLVNLGAIRDAFYAAGTWIIRQIARFLDWFSSLFASVPVEYDTPIVSESEALVLPAAEPSAFWIFLERILMIVAPIIGAALLLVLLVKLSKLLARAIRRLLARLRLAAHQLGEGVQEHTESILDLEELTDALRARARRLRKRFARPVRWQSLKDNRARVRWAYARWLAAHPDVSKAETVHEALRGTARSERVADIYDRARYSTLEITEDEALLMRDLVEERNGNGA